MSIKEAGTWTVSYLQVLDEHGNLDPEADPKLPDEDVVRLYQAMAKAREIDGRLLKLQRQGRIGTFAPATGQEAAICGAVFALKDTDWLVGTYRDLGGRLLRGEPLINGFLVWSGHEEGNIYDGGDRTLPVAIVLGSQAPIGVGIAYASRMKGEKDTAVLVDLGDGATSEGDFHEAMNFAGVWQVPVVFLCQNNGWAISTPRSIQTHSETIAQKAIAYGMPGVQVDGNDALAVYKVTKEALDRARSGGGPSFIEAVTYRMLMHTTADDPTRYRTDDELKEWTEKDPLIRFRKYITDRGLWDDTKEAGFMDGVKKEIEDAVTKFEEMKDFKPDAPFDFIYGAKFDSIEEQRASFLDDLRRDSENG
jgi:pyruvate dehydrogenase E1 component alpha subunit